MTLYQKQIYQIGWGEDIYYIFNKLSLNLKLPTGVKTSIDKSALADGNSDADGIDRNLKEDYIVDVDYAVFADENTNIINKLLFGEEFPVFFYETLLEKDIQFHWQYAKCIGTPVQTDLVEDDGGEVLKVYKIKLRLRNPYFYSLGDNDIKYLDLSTYFDNILRYDDGVSTYDSGLKYDKFLDSYIDISTLSIEDKQNSFVKCTGRIKSDEKKPLILYDRYIRRTEHGINTTNAFDTTLSTNNLTTVSASPLDQQTNTDNVIYLIEFAPLNKDEWIKIHNDSNNSGIKITWTGDTANANRIVYNSYANQFFDAITGDLIDITPNIVVADYDSSTTPRFLYFSGLLTNAISKVDNDQLTMQKSTSGSNQIKIKILKLNH